MLETTHYDGVCALLGPRCIVWKHLSAQQVSVRRAVLSLVAALSTSRALPAVLLEAAPVIGPLVLEAAAGEKDSRNVPTAWHTLVVWTRAFPDSYIMCGPRLSKSVVPRLAACLQAACFGSGRAVYPAVVLFLAAVPVEIGVEQGVYHTIVKGLWMGLYAESVVAASGVASALLTAFVDALVFLSVKRPCPEVHSFVEARLLVATACVLGEHADSSDVLPLVLRTEVAHTIVQLCGHLLDANLSPLVASVCQHTCVSVESAMESALGAVRVCHEPVHCRSLSLVGTGRVY
jgi:hypothetical protein